MEGFWNPPQNAKLRFLLSACTNSFLFCRGKVTLQEWGDFQVWSPPISMDTMFSHFLVHFSFAVQYIKKKSAEGAEDAEAPQAPGVGGLIFMGQKLT